MYCLITNNPTIGRDLRLCEQIFGKIQGDQLVKVESSVMRFIWLFFWTRDVYWLCRILSRPTHYLKPVSGLLLNSENEHCKVLDWMRSYPQHRLLVVLIYDTSWYWPTNQEGKIKVSHPYLLVTRVRSSGRIKVEVSDLTKMIFQRALPDCSCWSLQQHFESHLMTRKLRGILILRIWVWKRSWSEFGTSS